MNLYLGEKKMALLRKVKRLFVGPAKADTLTDEKLKELWTTISDRMDNEPQETEGDLSSR